MEFKVLLVCFVVTLDCVQCQDRRCVSICNEENEISNSGGNIYTESSGRRGHKGDRGIPGKAGPSGIQGPPGEKGNQGVHGPPGIDGAAGIKGLSGMKGKQGVKGESGSTDGIAAFQKEIRNLMTDLNHSVSLLDSKLNAAKEEIDGRLELLSQSISSSQSNENGSQLNAEHENNHNLARPVNCSKSDEDGVQLLHSGEKVYCRQHWRVIQRRFNGQVIFHNKTWNQYKIGFGSLSTEFWIGLDKIYHLTRNGGCRLRVELGAFDGSEAYAEYRHFSIGSESDLFRLHISGYNGTAGDSMTYNNNMAFTTIDRDNDRYSGVNCAAHGGGGRGAWWWNDCGLAKLNGRWGEGIDTGYSFTWYFWKGAYITLKSSMMMIRCD